MIELTVIVPGKNEEFMGRTIQDVLDHSSERTEVIAILDGYLPNPPLTINDERLTLIYNPISVGQRAAANQAARIARGKYLMKLDAHCAFKDGFDVVMLDCFKELGDDVTLAPTMKNFHIFDWVCENGHRRYQSPSGPCEECSKPTTKDVVWYPKPSPNSVSFRFDKTMHFQYHGDWGNKHPGDFVETMSLQGSCFMITKEKWFELDICSEEFHSWGQQGVEVACKTWLSGGKVMTTRRTWYAHMFRTRGGDFGFPYSNPQKLVNENRELSRELFQKNKWPLAIHKFQWLLDKFDAPDWKETKGMLYYTHNELDEKIAEPVRDRLEKIGKDKNMSITCSSLKSMNFGNRSVRFPSMEKGYLAMFKQILGGLEKSVDDVIFFTEHDVLYHESHFDFMPPDKDTFYYNVNVWRTRLSDGHSLKTDDCKQLSGMCGYRDALITHFRERYEMVLKEEEKLRTGYMAGDSHTLLDKEFNKYIRNMGFEPMTHNRIQWKNQFKCESWESEQPNIDLKHGKNATGSRWKKEQYRNQKWIEGWTESENDLPGWGDIRPILDLMR